MQLADVAPEPKLSHAYAYAYMQHAYMHRNMRADETKHLKLRGPELSSTPTLPRPTCG
jgi:hypothetical protein